MKIACWFGVNSNQFEISNQQMHIESKSFLGICMLRIGGSEICPKVSFTSRESSKMMTSAKMVLSLLNTYGSRDQSDGVIYQHLLSRSISGVSFCFIPCVEQISWWGEGGCTLQTSNCRLEYLFTRMLGTFKLLFPRTLLSFSYHFYNIQFNYSLYMREGYEKGFEQ